ncbi:MAG TPA: M15 family metallopeptidase [Clostridia bacterium]|nr:M15 family metallopeptidase [Clostridia bacterium]
MWKKLALLLALSVATVALQEPAPQVFRITPARPIAELRAEALKASPPAEAGTFRKPELVELITLDPTIKLDVRYAGPDNFLGTPVYEQARAFLQRPAAEALMRAHRKLREKGYGLLIHDGYRPWFVTKIFWDATPPDKREFVANPDEGSRHNRGCAVDLTLYELTTGRAVEMPSLYDEMTPRAYPEYKGGTAEQRRHRELLREAMESEGFQQIENEWWHFDYKDWKQYPILNVRFEELMKTAGLRGGQLYHRSGGTIMAPTAHCPDPALTSSVRAVGGVLLWLVVTPDGRPSLLKVARPGASDAQNKAALQAAMACSYQPGGTKFQLLPVSLNLTYNPR